MPSLFQFPEEVQAGTFAAPFALTFLILFTTLWFASCGGAQGMSEIAEPFLSFFELLVLLFTHGSMTTPTNLII